MVFSGFEIGIALPYPAASIERDYGYVPHHPLAEAYIRYIPPPHNRPTWDLTERALRGPGRSRLLRRLAPGPGDRRAPTVRRGSRRPRERPHAYLILRPEQKPRVLEALVQLSSQPPRPSRGSTAMNTHSFTPSDSLVAGSSIACPARGSSGCGDRAEPAPGVRRRPRRRPRPRSRAGRGSR